MPTTTTPAMISSNDEPGAPVLRLKAETIESDYHHHPSELVKGGVGSEP